MKAGFSLPQIGPQATPENLIRVAQRAEELGYHSLWVLERLLWPLNPREPYPASADGSLPEAYQTVFDPIETLTFVAAHTRKIRLGTSVLVLPYHTPIQLARRIATLDILSGGRVDLGVGAGWSSDEFQAAGTPFKQRGARSDEFLDAMIALWTKDPVSFDGRFYHIPPSKVGPKPLQKPHPPIYVAGFGEYAIQRAAKYGSGWNPAGVSDYNWLGQMISRLHQIGREMGRPQLDVVLRVFPAIFDQPRSGRQPQRQPMMGTLDDIRADAQKLAGIGVTELIYGPAEMGWTNSPSIDAAMKRMEQLIGLID
jgi:probable F420-dependent oxidoreductase